LPNIKLFNGKLESLLKTLQIYDVWG